MNVTTPGQIATANLYLALLARPADEPGFTYWSGVITTEPPTVDQINAFVAGSTEFTTLYGGSVTQNITTAYQYLFNRAPDSGGLAYWVNEVTSGAMTLPVALWNIAASATGVDVTTYSNKLNACTWLYEQYETKDTTGRQTYGQDYAGTNEANELRGWLAKLGAVAATSQDISNGMAAIYLLSVDEGLPPA